MDYWQKQGNTPLFEDIMWARPQTKRGAGKLLIVGGNLHGFAAVGTAYRAAEEAGAGVIRLVLPDSLKKTVGPLGPYEFAPSTAGSGSFARDALNELLIGANWADGVLIAGDLGRNSETSVLLENFVAKYSGQLTITKDAVDYFYGTPGLVAQRPDTTLVLSLAQLQKLGTALRFETPFLLSMGMLLLVQALHDFTLKHPVTIIVREQGSIVVAAGGQVSSTKLKNPTEEIWRVETAAKTSVFWLQHTAKPFEAMTSAIAI